LPFSGDKLVGFFFFPSYVCFDRGNGTFIGIAGLADRIRPFHGVALEPRYFFLGHFVRGQFALRFPFAALSGGF